MSSLTWEQAVEWLRQQSDRQQLVRDCYYDDPLLGAAKRFAASAEWDAVRVFLPPTPGTALDLGAGRGIGSYALVQANWSVTALEPDPSALVGVGAIRRLAKEAGSIIHIVQGAAEQLPFAEGVFDLIYGRQVLHHARDLTGVCCEIARTLKPGGQAIVTREHVITKPMDLKSFLDNHPLHKFYGGEYAYLLREYIAAISSSGLRLLQVLGPFESAINDAPRARGEWQAVWHCPVARVLGERTAHTLLNDQLVFGRWLGAILGAWYSFRDSTPGRLYSFVARKPRL